MAPIQTLLLEKDNWTPLMQAAFADLDDMAQMLVKHGAKKELTDNQGKTAHDLAIENNAAKTAYFVSFIPKLAPIIPENIEEKYRKHNTVEAIEKTTVARKC